MQQYQLIRQQEVSRPLERIFTFFEKPENLALITPPSLEFRLITPLTGCDEAETNHRLQNPTIQNTATLAIPNFRV